MSELNSTEETTQKRHPFSYSLGAGPYRYVGCYDMGQALARQEAWGDTARAFADAPKLKFGMGTCTHCGHAILDIKIIRVGSGDLYGVGSDCVEKVCWEGDVSNLTQMEKDNRRIAREKRQAATQRKIVDLDGSFQEALTKLVSLPHPNEFFASKGKTMADYYQYCSKNPANMKAAIKRASEI